MGHLNGRVAIVTGAGRGLGKAYALAMAREGCAVVVNDIGAEATGAGVSARPADETVEQIRAEGGRAVADYNDISNWELGRQTIDRAIEAFGGLHVLVNNAGILLRHTILGVSEEEWDRVIAVNLKGHMVMTKWAMTHWAACDEAGAPLKASIINTTSIGAMATFGDPSYSASKGAVANLGLVTAVEGVRYGVRANVIAPGGRTRLTMAVRGAEQMNDTIEGFDFNDPNNICALIVYLAMEDCPLTGAVLHASGNQIGLFQQWPFAGTRETQGAWTVDAVEAALGSLLDGRHMPSIVTRLADYMGIVAKAKAALRRAT